MDRHLADQPSIVGAPHDPTAIAERLRLAPTAGGLGDWSWDAKSDLVTISRRTAEVFGVPHVPARRTRYDECVTTAPARERTDLHLSGSIHGRRCQGTWPKRCQPAADYY